MSRHRSISSAGAVVLTVLSIWAFPAIDTNQLSQWVPFRNLANTHNGTSEQLGDAIAVSAPVGSWNTPTPVILPPQNPPDARRVPAAVRGNSEVAQQQGQAHGQAPGQAQGQAHGQAQSGQSGQGGMAQPQRPSGGNAAGPEALPDPPTQPPAAGQLYPVPPGFQPNLPWPTAQLRVRVIDGRTQQPLQGAEVVVIETEQRITTGKDGYTPYVDAPVYRDPRFRPLVAELHGQLAVIAYKNGYRDSIHMGIRMHEGLKSETTVWMYKIGPGDDRIEPVLYQVPYHHLWLVELADRFRSKTQPGEGPQRP